MTSLCPTPGSPSLRAIENALGRAIAEVPVLAPLLTAFGPLFSARARLRESAPGWTGPAPVLDAERFTQGVFVLAQMENGQGFQDMSTHLGQAASTMLPIMGNSFPAVAQELNILAKAVASGALSLEALAAAGFDETVHVSGVEPETVSFAAAELVRPFIERQAQDLLALVKDLPWRQPMCPVCGNAPNMSVLRRTSDPSEFIQAHGGQRFLRCSCCATEWTYKRVACPTCGCEDPEGLIVLSTETRPFERVDACTHCKTCILCLDTGDMMDVPDMDVAALAMLPLEMQAKTQGYIPMAGHTWSNI